MLDIKDAEAHQPAKELAAIEGTSLTSAVTLTLRAALAKRGRRCTARRLVLTGLMASARARGLTPNEDPIDDLYDPETGLPR